MEIIRGKISRAQKVVIYGPEGIGKSTLASKFPEVLFIDTEGSTSHMDVARTQEPSSWNMLMSQVMHVSSTPGLCKTLVIDTADWAERLCKEFVCAKYNFKSIEDPGYGKGYTYLYEEWGKLLNLLSEITDKGIHVVLTAHAMMRKFEQPDEMGAYDRWELKLEKKTAAVTKEWADLILFANYKTDIVKSSDTKKNKATGGARKMYTSHHPAWDAKNRHGLPDELDMDFAPIGYIFNIGNDVPTVSEVKTEPVPEVINQKVMEPTPVPAAEPVPEKAPETQTNKYEGLPKALVDLMEANGVSETEIQTVVAQKGYYPANMPVKNYDPDFINGVLVAAWDQVHDMIKELLPLPFELKKEI